MCNMIASEREKEIACVCVCVSVIREEVRLIFLNQIIGISEEKEALVGFVHSIFI